VHTGYYNAVLALREALETHVFDVIDKATDMLFNVRLIVTGHSLGGALASIVTAWALQRLARPYQHTPGTVRDAYNRGVVYPNLLIESVTFGAPKPGNSKFKDWLRTHPSVAMKLRGGGCNVYRVFTANDPIPCTPPSVMNFTHAYHDVLVTDVPGLFVGDFSIVEKLGAKKAASAGHFTKALTHLIDDPTNFTTGHNPWLYYELLLKYGMAQDRKEFEKAFTTMACDARTQAATYNFASEHDKTYNEAQALINLGLAKRRERTVARKAALAEAKRKMHAAMKHEMSFSERIAAAGGQLVAGIGKATEAMPAEGGVADATPAATEETVAPAAAEAAPAQ